MSMRLSIYTIWLLFAAYFLMFVLSSMSKPEKQIPAVALSNELAALETKQPLTIGNELQVRERHRIQSRALPKPKFFIIHSLFCFLIFFAVLYWQDNRRIAATCLLLWLALVVYMVFNIHKMQIALYGPGNIRAFLESRWLVFFSMFLNIGIMAMIARLIRYTRNERESALNNANKQLQENYRIKEAFSQKLQEEVDEQTEQLQAKNELLHSQAEALRNNDIQKTRLFAGISHELRTPITLIQGPLEQLTLSDSLAEHEKNNVDMALRNTRRLHGFVEDILDLTKINYGELRVQVREINISDWLKELVEEFGFSAKEKNIYLELYCPPRLVTHIDSKQFRKVVSILLHNALKFTPNNGHIDVSLEIRRNELILNVSDSGPGLSNNDIENCFDLFYQSPSHQHIEGTGIGLNLAKEITKLHTGSITATNNSHGGAMFTIKLPYQAEKHIISGKPIQASTTKPGHVKLNSEDLSEKPHVLFVEDNLDMQNYISDRLKAQFTVKCVNNGEEALTSIKDKIPDLVLSDWMMPKMDGITLLNHVRDNPETATLPVIILSGASDIEKKRLGYASLVDDYLVKPVDIEELILKITSAIRYHQQLFIGNFSAYTQPIETDNSTQEKEVSEKDDYIERIEYIINENLSDPLFDSEALASAMNMTLKTLSRKLVKNTELTPGLYIRHYRLKKALELKDAGVHTTQKELAFAVGFKSPGYFNKLLKQFAAQPANHRN
ncbi:Sensor histidine kinase TodS [BD1-7 clade bacterium]|uniref:histidine kinase n=1 Tax=BD1-7 clade bacterium TaxID=2029982 RepID=A0A5S9PM86_9GAMM|nr:Sensor histidine kinase TodS [BD1-7 clade bacterium]